MLCETGFEELDEGERVDFLDCIEVKVNTIELERSFGFVVVKLDVVLSDQLEKEEGDREQVRLGQVVARMVSHHGQVVELFRRQDVVLQGLLFSQHLKIAAMPVLLVHFQQVQLDIPLGTQENVLSPVVPDRYVEVSEVLRHLHQTAHDVDELGLGEYRLLLLLFPYGLVQVEVVVVAKGVRFLVLYAHLSFFSYQISTFSQLCQVNLGQVLVLGLRQLPHALHVLYIPHISFNESPFVIHYVLVWRLFQSEYFNRPELVVFHLLHENQFLQKLFHLVLIASCRR